MPQVANPTLFPGGTIASASSTPTPNGYVGPTTSAPTATATPHVSVPQTGNQGSTNIPNFDHIVLIVLENRGYKAAMDGTSMPHFAELAQKYTLLTNYFAISHPSVPNYIALMTGSTQNITTDCTTCFLNVPNLADELAKSGHTWKAYLESMPSPCFQGNANPYAMKHNPFIYFDSVRQNTTICDNSIVPMTQLDTDLQANKMPNFAFIMPDLCDSGHDCTATTADNWLNDMVGKLQGSSALDKNSLIVITFDEAKGGDTAACCGQTSGGGHVATILISPLAKQGFQDDTAYSHYSLLKTILDAWKLPGLGQTVASIVQPIVNPWTSK